jgi:heat shock protein HslJ
MRALFCALLLAACATAEPAPPVHLAGTSWIRVDDEHANPHGATMVFTERGASGHTGCNRWFTSVTQDGEELRFGNVGMTRMACQTQVQAHTERSLLEALRATRYAHYDQDALVLLDQEQRQRATFQRTD